MKFKRAIIFGGCIAFFSYFISPVSSFSAPSKDGRPGPVEYVNRPVGMTAQAFKNTHSGTKTVAVILVDFNDAGSGTSGSITMTESDISNIDSYFKKNTKNFEDYYRRVSYGKFTPKVTFSVKGGTKNNLSGVKSTQAFTMPRTMAYYGQDSQSSLESLIKDALDVSSITASNYDFVIVDHAGYGNETSEKAGDIWSASVGFESGPKNGFTTGAIVPARETSTPFGVICHEFGHQLGLPDLYATDTGKIVFGPQALMGVGMWNNGGYTPSHPCAWSKIVQGWTSAEELTGVKVDEVTKRYYDNFGGEAVKKIYLPGKSSEYFLLSYRKKGGRYDSAEYGETGKIKWGLLIEHIDESVGSVSANNINASYQPYPRVYAVTGQGWEDSNMFTAPYSNYNTGQVSGINIYDFYKYEEYMLYSFKTADFSAGGGFIEKPLNFPNPVDKDDLKTTISFKVKEPESKRAIRIYTPDGALVKSIKKELIIPRHADDNEVLYQADWNLNNSDGRSVSSGIYMYHVEAGSKDDFGTLVILK